jgi:two-component system, NarL family, sensor kinase
LKWYVEGFAQRSKIVVSLELAPDLGRLPRDVELSLYRIVQECLTNIHRHSRSLTATVRLYHSAGEVRLEVKDQGKGIAPERQLEISSGEASGVGLRGMLERVRLIGGTFDIQSDGSGTLIAVALPLMRIAQK